MKARKNNEIVILSNVIRIAGKQSHPRRDPRGGGGTAQLLRRLSNQNNVSFTLRYQILIDSQNWGSNVLRLGQRLQTVLGQIIEWD